MKTIKILSFALVISFLMTACNQNKKTYAIIETDFGIMKAELYDETPIHKENFIKLANEGFYDGTLFHRIISGFMIQGGDPQSIGAAAGQRLGSGGPGYTLEAEIGAPHFKGTLAAARTGAGNPEKRSSGSQFYVVQGRPSSDAQLDSQEKRFGFKYNQAQREKYKTLGGAVSLDMDYTVFGELVEGLDVLDKIAAVQKDKSDRPLKDIAMKVRIVK